MQRLRRSWVAKIGVLAALAVAAAGIFILQLDADGSSGPPLRIEVFAKQYSWSFGYPGEGNAFSANEFHAPDDRPIEFELHSRDAVHGFWIPEWDVKTNAIPGGIKKMEVTPQKTGVYQIICSVSCGLLHGAMKAKVIIEDPARFQHWVNGLGPIPLNWKRLIRLDREAESIRRSIKTEGSG